jgi:hypothetical protein
LSGCCVVDENGLPDHKGVLEKWQVWHASRDGSDEWLQLRRTVRVVWDEWIDLQPLRWCIKRARDVTMLKGALKRMRIQKYYEIHTVMGSIECQTSGDGWNRSSPKSGWWVRPAHRYWGATKVPPRFFKTRQTGEMCENLKSVSYFYGKRHKASSMGGNVRKKCAHNWALILIQPLTIPLWLKFSINHVNTMWTHADTMHTHADCPQKNYRYVPVVCT